MSTDLIPFVEPPDEPSRQVARKARRAKERTDLEVYRYGLGAGARSQMDQSDTWSAHDAAETAMEAELDLLNRGLAKAQSPAGAEIVGRWVNRLSNSDARRFARRFGG